MRSEMVYFKDISYMLSHVFFMAFIWLFLEHRFSRRKTMGVFFLSFLILSVLDYLKLNLFPDSGLCYFAADIIQIFTAQYTGIFISRKRNSGTLFIGLSASNYVSVGSITASILYIYTGNMWIALAGNVLMHLLLLSVIYYCMGDIFRRLYVRDYQKSWWQLCLIPMFFFCSFSSLAFFPYTLYEHPENILASIFAMITMLVSYVVVLQYLDSEMKQIEGYWKNVMFESYSKGLESQRYMVEQAEQNLRILRHDMRHYALMIDSLLDQGEYDEIRNIAGYLNEVMDENKVARYCENLIVNTILLKMAEQAKNCDVTLNLDVLISPQIPVNEYEFALVIANLLENAVTAVKDMKTGRFVEGKIHCTEGYLLIDLENPCRKEIRFHSVTGLPESEGKRNHGLGMQSVLAFCDNLGGNIDCYCENDRFRLILFVNF